mgnify:CR=1 FL=1
MSVSVSKKKIAPKVSVFCAEDYSYTVTWSEEDQVFIGRVAEFASLAAHGATQHAALEEITSVVQLVIEDLQEEKEIVPLPFSKRRYSGKFNVRVPESLHRKLSFEAEIQGVSLNHLIVHRLSCTT